MRPAGQITSQSAQAILLQQIRSLLAVQCSTLTNLYNNLIQRMQQSVVLDVDGSQVTDPAFIGYGFNTSLSCAGWLGSSPATIANLNNAYQQWCGSRVSGTNELFYTTLVLTGGAAPLGRNDRTTCSNINAAFSAICSGFTAARNQLLANMNAACSLSAHVGQHGISVNFCKSWSLMPQSQKLAVVGGSVQIVSAINNYCAYANPPITMTYKTSIKARPAGQASTDTTASILPTGLGSGITDQAGALVSNEFLWFIGTFVFVAGGLAFWLTREPVIREVETQKARATSRRRSRR